jgi:hypothetical protein
MSFIPFSMYFRNLHNFLKILNQKTNPRKIQHSDQGWTAFALRPSMAGSAHHGGVANTGSSGDDMLQLRQP